VISLNVIEYQTKQKELQKEFESPKLKSVKGRNLLFLFVKNINEKEFKKSRIARQYQFYKLKYLVLVENPLGFSSSTFLFNKDIQTNKLSSTKATSHLERISPWTTRLENFWIP
jgi:hypothetical protein